MMLEHCKINGKKYLSITYTDNIGISNMLKSFINIIICRQF